MTAAPDERATQAWTVDAADAGIRLDAALAARLALPRAQARRLLAAGLVRLDGRPVGAGAKGRALAAGAALEVAPHVPEAAQRPRPEPETPLRVLAEGDDWLAVDKPAGSPVHPLRETEGGCVLNAVIARHPRIAGVGEGGLRCGVVHRLDVDTTGVLLLALAESRWQSLRAAFRERRVEKRYRALVSGHPPEHGRADLHLRVARHRPARVRVAPPDHPDAREARLAWRVAARGDGASLLEIDLETGFLHQVRASLAEAGHPVLGDPVYGVREEGAEPVGAEIAPRPLLHAASIAVLDVHAASPDPPDLVRAATALGIPAAAIVA